jgi:hypothetical protein
MQADGLAILIWDCWRRAAFGDPDGSRRWEALLPTERRLWRETAGRVLADGRLIWTEPYE